MKQCKLCLQWVSKLQNSHFLSAGIYRRLRDDGTKTPNPWLITDKKAFQSSKQLRRHLLCFGCEQRLRKFGEDWALSQCVQQDGNFPLETLLAAQTPDVSSAKNPTRIYHALRIPAINIPALAYFAASIFWRGAIYPWRTDGTFPVRLGPYEEQFRLYLMGKAPFPADAVLWVAVREGKLIDRLTYMPIGARNGKFHQYKFPMPGFAFTLFVGKNVPVTFHENCLVHGHGNPLSVTPIIEPLLIEEALRSIARSKA